MSKLDANAFLQYYNKTGLTKRELASISTLLTEAGATPELMKLNSELAKKYRAENNMHSGRLVREYIYPLLKTFIIMAIVYAGIFWFLNPDLVNHTNVQTAKQKVMQTWQTLEVFIGKKITDPNQELIAIGEMMAVNDKWSNETIVSFTRNWNGLDDDSRTNYKATQWYSRILSNISKQIVELKPRVDSNDPIAKEKVKLLMKLTESLTASIQPAKL